MKKIVNCYNGNVMPKDAEPTQESAAYGCDACQYIKDNKLHQCSSFIFRDKYDIKTKEKVGTDWACSEAWQAILQCETSEITLNQTTAIESLRNETVSRQDQIISLSRPPDIKLIQSD